MNFVGDGALDVPKLVPETFLKLGTSRAPSPTICIYVRLCFLYTYNFLHNYCIFEANIIYKEKSGRNPNDRFSDLSCPYNNVCFYEPVQYLNACGFSCIILSKTRKKFAGILCVWQGFLTQDSARFAEKTFAWRH